MDFKTKQIIKTNTMTELQKIIVEIENFVLKVEHKMPSWMNTVCLQADAYIQKAELLMNNSLVVDFEKIVPSSEPACAAIVSILQTLDKVFRTVDASLQQGILNAAGASITTAIHGQSVPANHFLAPYTTIVSSQKILA